MSGGKKWSDSSIGQATTIAAADQFLIIQASTGQSKRITQAILSPATGNLLIAKLSLTAVQIKTLNSIPVQIVATPGSGKAIEVVSASASLDFQTIAYDSSGLALKTATAITSQVVEATILASTVSQFSRFVDTPSGGNNQLSDNQSLQVTSSTDATVGDSPLNVYVAYRIITL